MKDYEMLSKQHFDGQAKEYDRKDTMYYSKFPKISCKDVAEQLKNISFDYLLDVGCGTGYLIDLLKGQTNANYFGLDLSPEMLEIAKEKLGDAASLAEGSADCLPYGNDQFDVVTCIQSFHHYPYPQKAMEEVYRVLKPGGLYILSDTGCSGLAKWMQNHIFLKLMKSGDYAVYDRKDIESMMRKSKLQVVESRQVTKMIYTVIGRKMGV